MKKLMTMIAAVAMSFGLFAATPFSISFESAESAKGVDATNLKFDAANAAGWTWTGDALDMLVYAGDAYSYSTTTRRAALFQDSNNFNYLKLETGDKELAREMGTDNVFVDQLVKFTGFEDPQTNLVEGTKIAVWMSGTETDETVVGETNLYVTCAKVDLNGSVEQIALKIDNPADGAVWETEKWYRLTIKSIGNIFETMGPRAGFIVYIDGVQVGSSDEAATKLIAASGELTTAAAGYMAKGQLFPAIDAADTTFNTVAYKGIGWIDDVILDDQGPDFCQSVTVTPKLPDFVEITEIKDADGTDIPFNPLTYAFAVPADTMVTITFATDDDHFLTKEFVEKTITEGGELDLTNDVEAKDLVVTLFWNDYEDQEPFASAVEAFAKISDLEEEGILFVEAEFKTDDESVSGYKFYAESTIDIDGKIKPGYSTWTVIGDIDCLAGVENKKLVTVKDGTLTLAGLIKSGAVVTAEDITVGDAGIELSLASENGEAASQIVTTSELEDADFVNVPADYKVGKTAAEDEELEGYWIYQLVPVPLTTFTVYVEEAEENSTVEVLSNKVVKLEYAESYTLPDDGSYLWVTYKANAGYEFEDKTDTKEVGLYDDDDKAVAPTPTAINYTITYMNGTDELKGLSPTTYTIEAAATLPNKLDDITGVTLEGWYTDPQLTQGPVTVIPVGTQGNKTFYAMTTKIIDPVQEVIDEKVDETGLDDTQKGNVKKNMGALKDACGNIEAAKAWITKIYGDAKIPGAKLAATDASYIAMSVEYDLPIMTQIPTVAVEAADSTSGAPAFQFTITSDVDIDLAKAAVQKIVKYSADLATGAFGSSDGKVSITTTPGSSVMKAEFVAGPEKGFMKADFTMPTK